ncbi:hypothetical protein [Amycolatopsis viridis]|uniref:Secreted protein n=1 Tax=Amycolatopsis viridis TaxID=185678 RepID=A0ABX0SQD4_9PSEU|nr:hypothetical protein [Amycolatopsis viridis]NIH79171.1 hypothetical protein [Amycolatopsis viridis]
MRKTMVALLGVAMAVAFSVATAPAASAITWDYTMKTTDGDPGAILKFRAHEDVVELCDLEVDGYAAWAYIDDGGSHLYPLQIGGGHNNCRQVSEKKKGKYDLDEHRYISVQVCLVKENSAAKGCREAAWYND